MTKFQGELLKRLLIVPSAKDGHYIAQELKMDGLNLADTAKAISQEIHEQLNAKQLINNHKNIPGK
jgi:hypothetical protein